MPYLFWMAFQNKTEALLLLKKAFPAGCFGLCSRCSQTFYNLPTPPVSPIPPFPPGWRICFASPKGLGMRSSRRRWWRCSLSQMSPEVQELREEGRDHLRDQQVRHIFEGVSGFLPFCSLCRKTELKDHSGVTQPAPPEWAHCMAFWMFWSITLRAFLPSPNALVACWGQLWGYLCLDWSSFFTVLEAGSPRSRHQQTQCGGDPFPDC